MTTTVFVTHSSAPSGAELSLLRIVRAWKGEDRPVVLLGQAGGLTQAFCEAGSRVVSVPLPEDLGGRRRTSAFASPLRSVVLLALYARGLRPRIRSIAPTVVVARSLKAVLYSRLATLGTDVTFIWSVHDRLTRDYLGRAAWFYRNVVGLVCDGFIVNSESTLATVRTGRRPVLVLPPSVDMFETHRQPSARVRVTVLGRIAPWKGQDVAIRAFAAELGGTEAELVIVGAPLFGEDDYLASLHQLVHELGVGEQVRFTGQVDQPQAELAKTDILLHASRLPEPFGAVVLEGMGAGCVVIGTEPGGPAEVIDPGRNGFLAQAGDLGALRAALREAVELGPDRRSDLVRAARQDVQAYAPELLTEELERWLDDVVDGTAEQRRKAVGRGVL